MLSGAHHVRLRREELEIAGWRDEGLVIAAVSDLHTGAPGVDVAAVERVVASVNAAGPDLVALLGDYVDRTVAGVEPVAPAAVAHALARLRAPAYAVLGNHDRGRSVAGALRDAGLCVLANSAVQARPGLWIAGVSDAAPSLAHALAHVPDEAAIVLLAHRPDLFPRVPPRVALTLSGHTHGGQVAIPFLRARWTPTRFGERYMEGHVVEDGRHLVIPRGIGTSRFPIRIGSRPEVLLLEVRAA